MLNDRTMYFEELARHDIIIWGKD